MNPEDDINVKRMAAIRHRAELKRHSDRRIAAAKARATARKKKRPVVERIKSLFANNGPPEEIYPLW